MPASDVLKNGPGLPTRRCRAIAKMVAGVEVVYFGSLAFSIAAGSAVSVLKLPGHRKWASTSIGLSMLLILCGTQAVHAIITVIANLLILRFVTHCHLVSLIASFGYLGLFRSLATFGFEHASPFANAVQLVLTLRVIGLAFEVFDSRRARRREVLTAHKSDADNKTPTVEHYLSQWQQISPSLLDAVHYYFCFVGFFTGPYYKFKTFDDFTKLQSRIPLNLLPVYFKRLYSIPLYVMMYVLLTTFFDNNCLADEKFCAETTVAWRLLYISVSFFSMRLRFYTAWALAEAACVASGLGAYPVESRARPGAGPTVFSPKLKSFAGDDRALIHPNECDFETVHNIDEYQCEFVDSARGVLRAWNMTVQYWLYYVVYKRVPNKTLGLCLTMLVSAYWHGLHGGYYLGLLSTTVFILGEVYAQKAFKFGEQRRNEGEPRYAPSWFTLFNWWYRVRAFEYMSAGFLLITTARTLQYWQSVYFAGHGIAIAVFLVSFFKLKLFGRHGSRQHNKAE